MGFFFGFLLLFFCFKAVTVTRTTRVRTYEQMHSISSHGHVIYILHTCLLCFSISVLLPHDECV